MNGETAFKCVFICDLKFKKVGDHHFHDHVTVPALPGTLGSSRSFLGSSRSSEKRQQCRQPQHRIARSDQDVTYVYKKLRLKQNNEPFKNNWKD